MGLTSLVFVYGTLKRGFCRCHFLTGQRFLGEVRTRPIYRMFDCGTYPGLKVVGSGGIAIVGELWSVDPDCIKRLDTEEGVAEKLYARERIELEYPYPESETCGQPEAYFYLPSVQGFTDCGDRWV